MSSLNKVEIIGRLGRDPEVRSFQNGGKVVNLRIATSEKWRDRNTGEQREKTEWHAVSILAEGIAKIAEQYLSKGDLVYVEGQLETRKWQDQSGQDRYTTEIVLRPYKGQMRLLSGRKRDDADNRQRRGDDDYQRGGAAGGDHETGGGRRYSDMDDEIPF